MTLTGRPDELRIGDAEREAAASALGDHYAAGRITLAEFDQRSSAAYAARTNADLWPLFRDLPDVVGDRDRRGPRGRAALPVAAGGRSRRTGSVPFVAPLLLVVLALVVLTQLPWPLLLIVGWLWWGRMFRHWRSYSTGSRRAVRGSWS